MVKKLKYFGLVLTMLIISAAFTIPNKIGANGIKIIVIDPGHGGKDPGCQGSIHKEKEVSLAVALKLGKFIEQNFQKVRIPAGGKSVTSADATPSPRHSPKSP